MIRQVFSTNLKKLLNHRNMNGRKFAQTIGVSEAMVSRWRSGTAFPEHHHIDLIVDGLGITHSYLFDDQASSGNDAGAHRLELARIRDAINKMLDASAGPIKKK